jgi:hypothetical protein
MAVGSDKAAADKAAADKAAADKAVQEPPKLPADEVERSRKVLLNEINRIDNRANAAADNGLFDKQKEKVPQDAFEDIQNRLRGARNELYSGNFADSEYYTSLALRAYDKALYSTSRLWRFSNIYAGPVWIYLIGFLVAVLAFYWVQLDKNVLNLQPVKIQEAALHAATWGCVGGTMRGLWHLKDKVSDRKYRNSFRIYFLSVPFLGGLFGTIIYFIVMAGLFIIAPTQAVPILSNQTASAPATTATGTANQTNATHPSAAKITGAQVLSLAIIPLSTLAGFNWEWAVMIFKRIGDSFKAESGNSKVPKKNEETNQITAKLRDVFDTLFGIKKPDAEKGDIPAKKDERPLIPIKTNETEAKDRDKSPGNEKIGKGNNHSPRVWQWILDKGGHIWVFFVGIFLFMITLIYYTQDTTQISTPKFVIATIAGGVIGSVFRGMVILKPMLKYGLNSIESFFIYIPIRGLIIGAIIFLVILAISLVFEVRNNISFLLIIVFFVSSIAYVLTSKDKDDNYDLISDTKKKFSKFKEWIEGNSSPKEGDKQTVSDITKRYVIEYEQIKRFLYLIFPPLLILIFVFYNVNNIILLTMKILLFDIVVWWTLQIFSPLIRKDFRFYFAKTCIDISEEKKSEAERTRYLILALESYNRYLRRYLKLQFNNAKKIYSKVSCCSSFDRDYFILSLKKTFKTNDELQPAFFISKDFLQIPESEQFLINEPLWQKVKDLTNFLVGIIPVGISLFELFSRYPIKP